MKAKITVNKKYRISEIDKRIYGSFIEHIGRAVYTGIYEPEHKNADDEGFRKDVIDLVKKIGVPIVRYPGGNFVSGYNWEDGIGDKSKRPRRTDLAWKTIETNQVGIDEFSKWAKNANTDILMTVNLGTGTPLDAKNCIEYCNGTTDSYYANLRRKNGFEEPFAIKTWCLGNEMDGYWQIGHKTAQEYGRIAIETAKLLKGMDPSIELVLCGSSNYNMPTFGGWELETLNEAYDKIDYISLHQYYENKFDNLPEFLAKSTHMDKFIKSVASICDAVKAKKHSEKTVNLSFDEWNVWYMSAKPNYKEWSVAPHLLEDVYKFDDALLVGCMLITLQNNSDRVKIACLAQLVNVIAPIMTEPNGRAWVQTIFYPYMYASVYGRGTTMNIITECDTYDTDEYKDIPYIKASVIENNKNKELILFAVNGSETDNAELTIDFENYKNVKIKEHIELYADDIKVSNSANKENVKPNSVEIKEIPTLKKHSWNMIKYSYEE